jgi:hypothetical protein
VSLRPFPPASPFVDDDGSPDPALAAVLAGYRQGAADLYAVQRAILATRLLVPVVAVIDELGETANGSPFDKTAHMSAVTLAGRDGRRAQPVFTCIDSLTAWNPGARPFPTTAVDVARGAYAYGAVALLIDVAGPVEVVLEGPPMLALAEGRAWVPPVEDPDVLAAVGKALAGLPGLAGVDVGMSADADLILTLHVPGATSDVGGTSPRDVAQQAAQRLAAVDLLRLRLQRGLDVAVTPS